VILRLRNLLETRLLHIRVREQNEELERKVQERTRQLAESRIEILDRLALAGEYRDQDTAEHTRRVGNPAAALAAASRCGSEFVELIRHAAQLHDIGKIGVPGHILRKVGATIIQLKKRSGKQFDPDLTRAMVELLEDSGLRALAEATVSGMASDQAPGGGAAGVVGEELIR